MADGTTPLEQAYRAYEQAEGQVSKALDQLVATNGFADLLATSATNVMAATRLVNGTVDRIVRATRLAVRDDVTHLARQLARTEDKLERVLQEVQSLHDRLDALQAAPAPSATTSPVASPPAASSRAASPRAASPRATAPRAAPARGTAPIASANGTARAPRASAARQEPT